MKQKLSEGQIQAAVVGLIRKLGYLVHADQNGTQRSVYAGARAKKQGMCAGWPDLTIALADGNALYVELKRRKGVRSAAQIRVHDWLRHLGHTVIVVYADDPIDAWQQIQVELDKHPRPVRPPLDYGDPLPF